VKFEISKRARRQIEKISRWWDENRPAAPTMFLDELADAERLLRSNAEAGIAYARHRTGDVRRVLLAGSAHHLYYRYRRDRDEIVVLTVWGAPRERGPKL
jgi:plasmid stabilization system protein ParE